ncbi:hypothetical protein [Paracidovorax wautersii]|uniref:Uncharacterized protein n=1 Tax=Paracidovorax wautersii TaxID=1177982 RepID=A0ABU1IG92_9BURK|nr:hypothetical protein [Paracidovorax wautersii]MDR6216236.1 hypothetical protein [Paracidovorax wautersii]
MKAAPTLIESLASMPQVTTQGDLRRIVSNALLALARKEISATDVEAMSKGLDSISNSLNAEVKVAKMSIEMRERGSDFGKVTRLGELVIGMPPAA